MATCAVAMIGRGLVTVEIGLDDDAKMDISCGEERRSCGWCCIVIAGTNIMMMMMCIMELEAFGFKITW